MTYPEALVRVAEIGANAYMCKQALDVAMFAIGMIAACICVTVMMRTILKACQA